MRLFDQALPPLFEPARRELRDYFRLAAALSALVNILYLSPTLYMMQVYDRVVPTGGVTTLLWLTLIVAFALATLAVLDALRARIMVKAALRLDAALGATIVDHAFAGEAGGRGGASGSQPLRDFDNVRQALAGGGLLALFDVPWTPIYVIVAFLLHPLLGLMVLVSALLLIGVTFLNERANQSGNLAALGAMAKSYGKQERLAVHAELIRTLGMRSALARRQTAERRHGIELSGRYQLASGSYTAAARFLRMALQSLALGVGAWLAIEQAISIGAIIAASVLMSRALQPIEQLIGNWNVLQQGRQSLDALSRQFAQALTARTGFELPAPAGRISFAGVTVARDDNAAPMLQNVTVDIEAGTFVGIIGPSGAGKSTFARVAAGALRASEGVVRIDGADLRDWNPERLSRHIGYLPQDAALLPGTIAENIARFETTAGGEDAVAAKVLAAAQLAGVHDLIVSLPGGYDRQIDWRGQGLSAGQRQRIALARAVYGRPSVLILDEPNAALDADGETALAQAIDALRAGGTTILLIAHRASVLANAERLLVLVGGRVSLHGAREKVLAELSAGRAKPTLVTASAG